MGGIRKTVADLASRVDDLYRLLGSVTGSVAKQAMDADAEIKSSLIKTNESLISAIESKTARGWMKRLDAFDDELAHLKHKASVAIGGAARSPTSTSWRHRSPIVSAFQENIRLASATVSEMAGRVTALKEPDVDDRERRRIRRVQGMIGLRYAITKRIERKDSDDIERRFDDNVHWNCFDDQAQFLLDLVDGWLRHGGRDAIF
jgi:hypothetical protein